MSQNINAWFQSIGYEKVSAQLDKVDHRFVFSMLIRQGEKGNKEYKPLLTLFTNIHIVKKMVYEVTGYEVNTKEFSII